MLYYILMESMFLVMLIYMLFVFLFYKMINFMEMMSSYECGFDCKSISRLMFSYRFFLISILFIIFDVEISLMISVPFFMIKETGIFFFFFCFVLLVGLMYEYYYGSLEWLYSKG